MHLSKPVYAYKRGNSGYVAVTSLSRRIRVSVLAGEMRSAMGGGVLGLVSRQAALMVYEVTNRAFFFSLLSVCR